MKREYGKLNVVNIDPETMACINKAAEINQTSRSCIARMFLQLIKQIPSENLNQVSPVLSVLGIRKENHHADK